jgi:hypothetical protein
LIALGGHAQQSDTATQTFEQGFDMFGLPQGQTAFSGGNHDGGGSRQRHGEFLGEKAPSQDET